MDEANKRAITGIGAAIAIATVATVIIYVANESQNYVAKVDGTRVTQEEYDKALATVKGGPMGGMQTDDMLRNGVVRQLIDLQLVEAEAAKRHVEPTDKDIQAKLDEIKKPYGDDEHFAKVLEANHLTLAELKERIRKANTMEKMGQDLAKSDPVTDNQVRQYYDQHKLAFQTQQEVRASHILVKDEAKAKELELKLKNGADFAELAKANSLDGSKTQGGDLGFFGRGKMVPEFENEAFSLKKGEHSKPIKTQFGYHIIKVTDIHPAVAKSFDQVKDEAKKQLTSQHEHELLEKWLDEARKKANIQYKDGFAPPTPPPTPSPAPTAAGGKPGAVNHAIPGANSAPDPASGGKPTPIPTATAAASDKANSTKDHAPTPAPKKP